MSRRNRSLLKGVAILLVLVAVLMKMDVIIIPALSDYIFWIVVIGFAISLITSR